MTVQKMTIMVTLHGETTLQVLVSMCMIVAGTIGEDLAMADLVMVVLEALAMVDLIDLEGSDLEIDLEDLDLVEDSVMDLEAIITGSIAHHMDLVDTVVAVSTATEVSHTIEGDAVITIEMLLPTITGQEQHCVEGQI